MKYTNTLIISLLLTSNVVAADSLTIGLSSYHHVNKACDRTITQCDYKFNSVNSGLGYTKELDKYSVSMGFYQNSFYQQSNYVGISKDWKYGGVMANFVTGYTNADIVPLVGVYGTVQMNSSTALEIMLPYAGKEFTIIAAQLRVSL